MINVLCMIIVAIDANGVNILHNMDVEGKVVSSNDTKYLVDFSKGIEKRKNQGIKIIGEDFKRLVDKEVCVKI